MTRRIVIVVAASVAAALIVAGALWWFAGGARPSARDVAEDYLAALATGDAAAIATMRGQTLGDETADAFAGAAYIDDGVIDELDETADTASVRASAAFAGQRRDISFTLERADDGWMLTGDDTGSLTVRAATGAAARIGDAVVSTDGAITVLPAVYSVAMLPDDVLDGSAQVAVTAGDTVETTIDVTLAEGATEVVQAQLDAHAESCAAPTTAVPPHCGFGVPWPADLASLASLDFSIEQYPALERISLDERRFDAIGGILVATAIGAAREGGESAVTYRTDDWALRGSVGFDGPELVLHVF